MALRRVAPAFANYDFELASPAGGNERISPSRAIYTFRSVDAYTSYRGILRRFRWEGKTAAASRGDRIWIPVRTEKFTHDSLD